MLSESQFIMKFIISVCLAILVVDFQIMFILTSDKSIRQKSKSHSTVIEGLGTEVLPSWSISARDYPSSFQKSQSKAQSKGHLNSINTNVEHSEEENGNRVINKMKEVAENIKSDCVKSRKFWTKERNQKLADLFHKMHGDDEKIYTNWVNDPSNQNAVSHAQLKIYIRRLLNQGVIVANEEEMKRWTPMRYIWNPIRELELMRIWHKEYKGEGDKSSEGLLRAWRRLHEPFDGLNAEKLWMKVNSLLKKGFKIPSEHPGGESITLNMETKRERDKKSKLERKEAKRSKIRRRTTSGKSSQLLSSKRRRDRHTLHQDDSSFIITSVHPGSQHQIHNQLQVSLMTSHTVPDGNYGETTHQSNPSQHNNLTFEGDHTQILQRSPQYQDISWPNSPIINLPDSLDFHSGITRPRYPMNSTFERIYN